MRVEAVDTPSWEIFEKTITDLREKYGNQSFPLLFRGQGNSQWTLTTTLDRNATKGMSFLEYYQLIVGGVAPEVSTFAGVDVPQYSEEIAKSFFNKSLLFSFPNRFPDLQTYRYMAYLRHLGFPSPLLDWSRSPYVAAFFAFRDSLPPSVEKRSIYAYCKSITGVTGGAVGEPTILPIGPYVQAHHRHFRQRCDYTICASYDIGMAQWRFDSHQGVVENRRPNQDFLWKFDIPSTEQHKVLGILNDYNLNAFSLFGSEESLLETMWLREYILRESKARRLLDARQSSQAS
jgi:hypothetical protein